MKAAFLLAAGFLISVSAYTQCSFQAGDIIVSLDARGSFTGMKHNKTSINYLSKDTAAPLITLVSSGQRYSPASLRYNKSRQLITLEYGQAGVILDIKLTVKPTHALLELVRAVPQEKVDAIVWGPIPITINKIVGEVIGVARDEQVALGLQVLNVKTLGGDDPNSEGSTWARGIAAQSKPWGCLLQAYSLNRDKERKVDAWGGNFSQMPVAPIKGETTVGSRIALFSCAAPATLDRLEAIELAEQLPHPTLNGVWFRRSPLYGRSYMISSFSEAEADEMIGYAKKAGLISLYHEGPFQSWGHFILDSVQFPSGVAGLKNCADKAHAAGLLLGIHTLTNFINTNDPYVTPVPDQRLSCTGSSLIINGIDDKQTTIEVADPFYFADEKNNFLHTVRIGAELIRYRSVSKEAPYRLLDCERGAFGTRSSAHIAGTAVCKLMDHPYQVFFPDMNLNREIAGNLARLLNETGVDHWDFDGHEGGLSTGQGDYGIEVFSKEVTSQLKQEFLCGTSLSKTFYWHIGSYYNWGEPWYGGFKESMQQYRIDNQSLFERNYMPHMLGWYLLGSSTTMAEMEWMLARAAGYDAGFAMVARPKDLRSNPQSGELLDAIREWESARAAHAFSPSQQAALKDPQSAFHLVKKSEGLWILQQYGFSDVYVKEKILRQPGEPTYTEWNYEQIWEEQPLQFLISIGGSQGSVKDIVLQIDQYRELKIPIQLKTGESLVYDGQATFRVYDKDGRPKSNSNSNLLAPVMNKGRHKILVNAVFEGDARIEWRFKGIEKTEEVHALK
ncbi:MAG: hypothetical protein RL732_271 [Bacteroidota bacterium]